MFWLKVSLLFLIIKIVITNLQFGFTETLGLKMKKKIFFLINKIVLSIVYYS